MGEQGIDHGFLQTMNTVAEAEMGKLQEGSFDRQTGLSR